MIVNEESWETWKQNITSSHPLYDIIGPFYVYLFSLPVLTVYGNTHMLSRLWKRQIYSPFFIIEAKESTLSQISCKQLCSPDSLRCITAERSKVMGNSETAGYISVQKTKTHIF